ncbi:MAG: flippase activity-associated protein Agl23 [Planctomycetota bacterium]
MTACASSPSRRLRPLPGVLLLAAAVIALWLRVPYLNVRPVHGDEAVHMYKCNDLWTTGEYRYNPAEFHGPTLYYATLPVLALSGAADWRATTPATFRMVTVVFGVGLVLVACFVMGGPGRTAGLWAALFTAVSPALTFYSRYYIQETLLVSFTAVVLLGGRQYLRSGRLGWAVLAGVGIGLMHATKETAIIAWAAMAAALLALWLWSRARGERRSALRRSPHGWPLLAGCATAIVVSVACFSVGFRYWRGPLDSLLALGHYVQRAGGAGHAQPWHDYLRILVAGAGLGAPTITEALIVGLALVGALTALLGRGHAADDLPFLRFLTIFTLLLTAAYAVIPYKTPWSMLGFQHGLVYLAGAGAAALVDACRRRAFQVATALVLLIGSGHLAWQSWRINTRLYTHPRNPYVYGHPLLDVEELARYVEQLAAAAPQDRPFVVHVITDNPWPLPWYLRHLEHVGYWEWVPPEPDADVVIVDADLGPELRSKLRGAYDEQAYAFRPYVHVKVLARAELRREFERRHQAPAPAESQRAAWAGSQP